MNRRSLFHHAVGIGSLCLTVALLYTAYSGVPAQVGFLLVVVAFMPGFYGLRYLRGRSGWRTR
jgi:hypothetical protein